MIINLLHEPYISLKCYFCSKQRMEFTVILEFSRNPSLFLEVEKYLVILEYLLLPSLFYMSLNNLLIDYLFIL